MNPISTRLCKGLKIGLPDWTFLWTLKPITLFWSTATEQPEPHKETICFLVLWLNCFLPSCYSCLVGSLYLFLHAYMLCISYSFKFPRPCQNRMHSWVGQHRNSHTRHQCNNLMLTANLRKVTSGCETWISGKGRRQYMNTALWKVLL